MHSAVQERTADDLISNEQCQHLLSSRQHELEQYLVFFDLIGTVLSQFPTFELFETLIKEAAFEDMPLSIADADFSQGEALLSQWSKRYRGTLSKESYHELLADNTYLFAGLQEMVAPPWESFYFNKERMIFQKETMEVRSWYRNYGLQISKLHNEPDDHIGLELVFIARLLEKALHEQAPDTLSAAYAFVVEHPLRWAEQWASRVKEHAKSDLYTGLALLVPASLHSFRETFQHH